MKAASRSPLVGSLTASVLLFLCLVLGNVVLAKSMAPRVDLTEDRIFTLSDASKNVLKSLTDPAKLSVYWGDKLPAKAEPVRRRLLGLLQEYAAESDGRLEVVWVTMDDAGREEAQRRGIHEGAYSELEANKVTEVRDYDGIAITYESKTEKVDPLLEVSEDQQSLQLASSLEYELTAAFYKLTRTNKAIVGLVRPAPPPPFMAAQGRGGGDDRYSVLAQAVLSKVYGDDFRDAVSVDSAVPPEVTVLVVPGPKGWTEKQVFNLEQFVLRGGKLLLLLDPVSARQVFFNDQPPGPSGLEDWLTSVGVSLTPGVVGDMDEEHMGAAASRQGLTGFPFFVNVLKDQLNQANPGTRDFKSVPFYFPSEVVVDAQKQVAAGRTFDVLATTSPKGFVRADVMGLNSGSLTPPADKEMGAKTLLVRIDGTFTSYWKGKLAPGEKPPEPATPPAPVPADAGMPTGMDGAPPPATPEPATGADAAMDTTPAMTEPAMDSPPAMADPAMDAAPSPIPQPAMEREIPKAPVAPPTGAPPTGAKGPEGEAGAPGAPAKDAGPARLDSGHGLIIVCGDAELVSDDFSGGRKDITQGVTRIWGGVNGFAFVNNLVDWMTGSADLLALRARGSDTHRLDEVKPEVATTATVFNYLCAPLLILIVGVLVFVVRKYRS